MLSIAHPAIHHGDPHEGQPYGSNNSARLPRGSRYRQFVDQHRQRTGACWSPPLSIAASHVTANLIHKGIIQKYASRPGGPPRRFFVARDRFRPREPAVFRGERRRTKHAVPERPKRESVRPPARVAQPGDDPVPESVGGGRRGHCAQGGRHGQSRRYRRHPHLHGPACAGPQERFDCFRAPAPRAGDGHRDGGGYDRGRRWHRRSQRHEERHRRLGEGAVQRDLPAHAVSHGQSRLRSPWNGCELFL